ncbi:hypothetical protein LCGC14_2160500, partial [marine sediment metagenome]
MSTLYKIKKFFIENYRYYIPLIIIILLIFSIFFSVLSPFIYYYITNEGDIDRDSTTTTTTTYTYNNIIYDDAVYVHKDGDNSDGESWETAYTTMNVAVAVSSVDLDDMTIIFVGLGLFDVDVAEQLDINKNIHIVGSGRHGTVFSNSHILADFVFNVTRHFGIEYSSIYFNSSSGGINVYGNNTNIQMLNMGFDTEHDNTGTTEALRIDYGEHGRYETIHFHGENTTTTAINISNSDYNHFNDIEIHDFNGTGIQICNDSNGNIFSTIYIDGTALGLDIDSGVGQYFRNFELFNCTVNIDDEVGNSYWYNVITESMIAGITPDNLVGININTAIGADTYGLDVLVFDGSAIDSPYYIIALIFETSAGERYGFRAWYSFSSEYIYETIIEAKFANQIERLEATFPRLFNAHSQIYISIKSESGNDDMTVW